ncbi:MAG: response regulator, partial [Lentisphaerota bacterium]
TMFGLDVSKFKIVISDVVLPDGNGVELIGELLKTQPGLKVLLTSGYTDEKSRWKEINGIGYRFLYKPYPLKELLRIVHEILKVSQPGK